MCRYNGEACIFSVKKADSERYEDANLGAFEKLRSEAVARNLTRRLCAASPAFHRHALRAKARHATQGKGMVGGVVSFDQYRTLALSGGLFTLLLAQRLCTGAISVYGLEVEKEHGCCQDKTLWYKYYEAGRQQCCAKARETHDEHALLAKLLEPLDSHWFGQTPTAAVAATAQLVHRAR